MTPYVALVIAAGRSHNKAINLQQRAAERYAEARENPIAGNQAWASVIASGARRECEVFTALDKLRAAS